MKIVAKATGLMDMSDPNQSMKAVGDVESALSKTIAVAQQATRQAKQSIRNLGNVKTSPIATQGSSTSNRGRRGKTLGKAMVAKRGPSTSNSVAKTLALGEVVAPKAAGKMVAVGKENSSGVKSVCRYASDTVVTVPTTQQSAPLGASSAGHKTTSCAPPGPSCITMAHCVTGPVRAGA